MCVICADMPGFHMPGHIYAYQLCNIPYSLLLYCSKFKLCCIYVIDLVGHVRGHMIIETNKQTSFEG